MANPVLARDTFVGARAIASEDRMTLAGAVTKTGVLMAVCAASALAVWVTAAALGPSLPTAIMGAAVAGLVVGFTTVFVPRWAPVTAPLYAILEGLALGGITLIYNALYRGLPLQALALTIVAGGTMLALYATRVVRVTEQLRAVIVGATLAILLYYLVAFVAGFFGVRLPFLVGGGWMSIGFSLLVVGVATLNFLLDFDLIERAAEHGAPRYMEWYGAFGVLVTFVWLYLEILRLLSKLRQR
ncbi:MAG TPA: Bax inhibitor-1/YccA family protein [Gemmatimonadales bacterium]|jgi:uncharacterized YccA/Bax inhibitor family protein|nr:Bax inhibitor-1/YccA family protein [Gemmatimonadales bacterium]